MLKEDKLVVEEAIKELEEITNGSAVLDVTHISIILCVVGISMEYNHTNAVKAITKLLINLKNIEKRIGKSISSAINHCSVSNDKIFLQFNYLG